MNTALYKVLYRSRRRQRRWLDDLAGNRVFPIFARTGAVLLLAASLVMGLAQGDHLTPGSSGEKIASTVSGLIGYSARHIRIVGLDRADPEAVLNTIGVRAEGSLIGFDSNAAESRLRNLDWVSAASVHFLFPNRLEIQLTERQPFAIWQRDGKYYLIDQTGAAMGADPRPYAGKLLLITGEGAHLAAHDLVNQLESNPALKSRLVAAGRVGQRRWNLHFPNGVKALLPESGVAEALARLEKLENDHGILERAVAVIDLRLPDRLVVLPLKQEGAAPDGMAGVKLSRQ